MGGDGPELSMSELATRVEDAAPYPDLYNGSVAQVMDRDIQYVQMDTPLNDALRAMRSVDAEFFPVVADECMVGLLTNSDVPARHAPVTGSGLACVGDAMIHDFVFCFDDTDVGEAAQIMEKNQVSCIPVLDRLGRLVGMIRSMQSLDASVYEPHLTD
jgi:CBS domain-containing protein